MIREVRPEDTGSITAIYNEYVAHSVITFETEPVREEEMRSRITGIVSHFPYFVYETEGKIAGYCYAHAWKERAAYRYTLETTVYLASEYQGKGIGKQLMQTLINECRHRGYHALIACITEGNEASNSLHQKLGFKQVSHFEKVGLKFDRWLDVFDYELILIPESPGITTIRQVVDKKAACLLSFSWVSTTYYLANFDRICAESR